MGEAALKRHEMPSKTDKPTKHQKRAAEKDQATKALSYLHFMKATPNEAIDFTSKQSPAQEEEKVNVNNYSVQPSASANKSPQANQQSSTTESTQASEQSYSTSKYLQASEPSSSVSKPSLKSILPAVSSSSFQSTFDKLCTAYGCYNSRDSVVHESCFKPLLFAFMFGYQRSISKHVSRQCCGK